MLLFGLERGETDMNAVGQEIQRYEKLIDDLWGVTLAPLCRCLELN